MNDYLKRIVQRFWEYRAAIFQGADGLFDQRDRRGNRPPVFTRCNAFRNILADDPGLGEGRRQRLIGLIPAERRHRWFGSMRSSQALAQSVFGTLEVMGKAHVLAALPSVDERKTFPFEAGPDGQAEVSLESEVTHLGEPRRTSLDVRYRGARRVAVECKFAESDVGHCSRPKLNQADPQHCDGSYAIQHGRKERCALAERGVQYWHYLPLLFKPDAAINHDPCPLNRTYQLVRNVLGICIQPDGTVSPDALVVLIYDDRNPAFQPGGAGHDAFNKIRALLREPARLLRCTWQDLVGLLRRDDELQWLTGQLGQKYGF